VQLPSPDMLNQSDETRVTRRQIMNQIIDVEKLESRLIKARTSSIIISNAPWRKRDMQAYYGCFILDFY
jgi:hypothetical protein